MPGRLQPDQCQPACQRATYGAHIAPVVPCPFADRTGARFTGTADTALRLARYLGTSDELWLDLQCHYDIEIEIERERLAGTLDQISPLTS